MSLQGTPRLTSPRELFRVQPRPYRHAIAFDVFPVAARDAMASAISSLVWNTSTMETYRYETSTIVRANSRPYSRLFGPIVEQLTSSEYVEELALLFGTQLSSCVDVTFHRMTTGHYTARHSDSNEFGEKLRLIYYFSDPADYEGGELIMYSGESGAPFQRQRMKGNSLFAFEMGYASFHEVKPVLSGCRISVVFTYG